MTSLRTRLSHRTHRNRNRSSSRRAASLLRRAAVGSLAVGLIPLALDSGSSPAASTNPATTTAATGFVAAAGTLPAGINFGSGFESTFNTLTATRQAQTMTQMAESGVTWIRVDIPMSGQVDQNGNYYWHDAEIKAALAAHIQVLGVLAFAPSWAKLADGSPDPAQFATFVKAAVARYSPMGVHAYEVWNEPNLHTYWQANPNPAEYTTLLKTVYPVIKSIDPSATVVTGGLAPTSDTTSTLSPQTFLADMYADGAQGSFDAVGDHPYSYPDIPSQPDTWNPFTYLPALYAMMAAHGDGAKQIWFTEYGAPTSGPGAVSEALQAQMINQAFAVARTWSWAGPMFLFDWQDNATDGGFGLLGTDGTAKPALSALTQALTDPADVYGYTPVTALSGGVDLGRWADWTFPKLTADQQSTTMTQAAATGATWVRINVPFHGVLTNGKFQGQYTWPADTEIRDALAHGLHVDAVLTDSLYSLPWYALNSDGSPSPTAFPAFAKAAVARYSALGVHTYEVTDEPNTSHYWNAPVNAAEYATLLRATYPVVKAVDPAATVLVGDLAWATSTSTTITAPASFVADLYADGAAGYFDAVGVNSTYAAHVPEQPDANSPWAGIPAVHAVMAANGDGAEKIWLTGSGASISANTDAEEQAAIIDQSYTVAASWSWAGPLIISNLTDNPTDGTLGLQSSPGTPRPAMSSVIADNAVSR